MGFGKSLKKFVGKAVNVVTGGNDSLNKVVGVALAPVTGGASLYASNEATKQNLQAEAKKEAQIREAEEAAETQKRNEEYAAFEKKIIGQRDQRVENAHQSRTDFTSSLVADEDRENDPRAYKMDRLLAKKRKLIGFE